MLYIIHGGDRLSGKARCIAGSTVGTEMLCADVTYEFVEIADVGENAVSGNLTVSKLLTHILSKDVLTEAENVFTKLCHGFSCPVCVSVLSVCVV